MKNKIVVVYEFYIVFGLGIKNIFIVDFGKVKNFLCYKFMWEENEEYLEVVNSNDLVEVVDVFGDMFYIFCGIIIEYGM